MEDDITEVDYDSEKVVGAKARPSKRWPRKPIALLRAVLDTMPPTTKTPEHREAIEKARAYLEEIDR